MSHSHHHHHSADRSQLGAAFLLNFTFTVVEVVGGFWTDSIAILSDALHDLGDSLALGLAWYLQRVARRGSSDSFHYGYARFNTLGAAVTGLILLVGSLFILARAIPELRAPEQPDAGGMIWLAVLGVLVNGAAVLRLRRGGHSLNERAIALHLMEDVLGWVAVLVGSILMYFFDLPWLDAALSIGIAIYILSNVLPQLREAGRILLMGSPREIDRDALKRELTALAGVAAVDDLRLWTLDGERHVAELRLRPRAAGAADPELRERIRRALAEHGVTQLTVEWLPPTDALPSPHAHSDQ